nr:MAG: capsid protein [Chicken astrovirus]QXO14926.1 MAG: capsid protein [Chicken astrovirus]QXO14931.1 MAG: capsid protein [Chicken astrovirus]
MPGPAGPANGGARPKTQTAKSKKAKKPPSQKKPSQQRPLKKELRRVEKQVKVLKKRTNGPKQNDVFSTTVTLGTISGQSDNGLTRQIRVPFNPTLCKSSDGGSTTPLSIRGSMYQMWKVLKAELRATPLTGGANIVGSVGFMALTLNGLEATADSIDTIKARKHVQIPIGRSAVLRVLARDCAGPREGWWLTDTSSSPADSYGPAVDLMLAYKTSNLLNVSGSTPQPFLGTLWQVELKVTYAFSTYDPKPGLQTLVSQTLDGSHQVTIQQSTTDGSLIMTTNDPMLLSILTPRVGGQRSGKSQTVWAVAGAAIEAAAPLLGPWGWLLKGGFWLVRKIFGATVLNTGSQYQLYPSIEAAMADQPIYGQSGSTTITLPIVHVSEVMNPNSENNDLSSPTSRALPPAPSQEKVLPLTLIEGQQGVPALYTYNPGTGAYSPMTRWTGGTLLLTGVPEYELLSGTSQQFGARITTGSGLSPAVATSIQVYDFTKFGVFFGAGNFLNQGGVHTAKTLLTAITGGSNPPWLDCSRSTWSWPDWLVSAGYPKPTSGDWWLQMQNITDTTSHTTPVGIYFLIAYGEMQQLVAFWHVGSAAQAEPTSLMCLYNVDAGRAPVRVPHFILTTSARNEVEFDGESDIDDDISLADSCLNQELGGVDQLEQERAELMRRLRDLDLRRFNI